MGTANYTMETLPCLSKEDLDRVAALIDEEIDCSDIPEIKDLSSLRRKPVDKMYKPEKVAFTCKLDADVVAWLEQGGKAYEAGLNSILRQLMTRAS